VALTLPDGPVIAQALQKVNLPFGQLLGTIAPRRDRDFRGECECRVADPQGDTAVLGGSLDVARAALDNATAQPCRLFRSAATCGTMPPRMAGWSRRSHRRDERWVSQPVPEESS